MPTGPECTTGSTEPDSCDYVERSERRTDDRSTLSRRHALTALGSLSLGATAGCLDSIQRLAGAQIAVEPEQLGEQRQGTPGEFYTLLEENGIVVDELYHDTGDNTLSLFYDSTAEDEVESDEEIGIIFQVFRGALVHRDSDVTHLYTEVQDRFDGQVKGWGIDVEWIEMHDDGEITDQQLWSTIAETKAYEDGDADGEGQPEVGDGEDSVGEADGLDEDGEEADEADETEEADEAEEADEDDEERAESEDEALDSDDNETSSEPSSSNGSDESVGNESDEVNEDANDRE